MKEIKLTQGKTALVDDLDYEEVSQYKWFAVNFGSGKVYAARQARREGGKQRQILMHRMLLNPLSGVEVDHINGDGLDNRRENLRTCSHKQNTANRKKTGKPKTSQYKGVGLHKGRWVARIQEERLGSFSSERDAAVAYNNAAKARFGEFAYLNQIEETDE